MFLRSPAPSDRDEFIALMRGSRSFHRALATAPTDDDRFDAYLTDSRRSDFEAMLQCRREDLAILGCFNLSQIVRRSSSSDERIRARQVALAGRRRELRVA